MTGSIRRAFLLAAACAAWAAGAAFPAPARAADPPAAITIGTLYAASGTFASTSTTTLRGLQMWVEMTNAAGGVYVRAFDRKLPVKLIAYDDQSNTGTAAALYNRLITQDHVDLLVADMGSVMTSVAVPIAREHHQLLFNQTGTGAAFFTKDNPYIVLVSAQMSVPWASTLAGFLNSDAAALGVKRIALLYATNDFTLTQANTVRDAVKAAGKMEIVYDAGVPTDTSNFVTIVNSIAARQPDAVIDLSYPNADIAFLRAVSDAGASFNMIFTIYTGIEFELLHHAVGDQGVDNVFAYVPPSLHENPVDFGMTLSQFRAAWDKRYAGEHMEFGFNSLSGYNTGLVLERTLAAAESLDQLELRRAVFSLSGHLRTLGGSFKLRDDGAQEGLANLIGQVQKQPDGKLRLLTVYPNDVAEAKPVYPRPGG
jgi:branched-chain amino acid transport system substrate-binding protein